MGPAGSRVTLSETNIANDLGVYTLDALKPAVQCEQAAAKTMRVVRMIHKYFEDLWKTCLNFDGYINHTRDLTLNMQFKLGHHTW